MKHNNKASKNPDLCRSFVEHYLTDFQSWSHTQLNFFNATLLRLVSSNFPSPISAFLRAILRQFIFSITVFHSDLGPLSTISCTSQRQPNGLDSLKASIFVDESSWICPKEIIQSLNSAILSRFKVLRLLPIPFARFFADYMRKNQLGGWHFGGSLPMTNRPCLPHHIHVSGQIHGLRRAYIIDSSSLPSIPGSSIAYLTMANAHRIARQFLADVTKI